MPSNWKTYKLGDLIEVKHGFAFKGEFFSDIQTNDILLTPGNFKIGGGFKTDKFKYYNGELPEEYILHEGDILIIMTDLSKAGDTLGYPAKIPPHNGIHYLHNQRLGLIKLKLNELDKDFLYWILRTPVYQNFILGSATGSTVRHTSPTRIYNYEFEAPKSIPEQQSITSILSFLDDKIELNLQMNRTLEVMAQAIFKQWFVNFQFPCFDDKLVGGLPKGWRMGKLGEVLELQYGKALKSENRINGKFPVVGSTGIVDFHDKYLVKSPGIVIGRKGTIGKVIWLDEDFFPINTTFFAKDLLGVGELFFHYYILLSQNFKNIASDGAVPGLNRNEALRNSIIIPSIETIKQFNDLVKPFFKKRLYLKKENQTLNQLRDSLLPKLMNGKIKVNV